MADYTDITIKFNSEKDRVVLELCDLQNTEACYSYVVIKPDDMWRLFNDWTVRGKLHIRFDPRTHQLCPRCKGDGFLECRPSSYKCPKCKGTGFVKRDKLNKHNAQTDKEVE